MLAAAQTTLVGGIPALRSSVSAGGLPGKVARRNAHDGRRLALPVERTGSSGEVYSPRLMKGCVAGEMGWKAAGV